MPLAVLAGWQLRHHSAVSAARNGNFGVDPVAVIAPALALAAAPSSRCACCRAAGPGTGWPRADGG